MNRLSTSQEKLIRQLHSRHGRKKVRYLLVEGIRSIEAMLQADISPDFIAISPDDLTQPGREFTEHLLSAGISLVEGTAKRFQQLSDSVAAQGIIAVVPESELPSSANQWKSARLLIYLDEVSDPGNVGTIIRTAAGCNVDIIALSAGCADILNPKVIRSTAGAIFAQPLLTVPKLETFLAQLESNDIALIGSDARANKHLDQLDLTSGKYCLAFGSEAEGLSEASRNACSAMFKLRSTPTVESFNVAAAAAIAIHDVACKMKLI